MNASNAPLQYIIARLPPTLQTSCVEAASGGPLPHSPVARLYLLACRTQRCKDDPLMKAVEGGTPAALGLRCGALRCNRRSQMLGTSVRRAAAARIQTGSSRKPQWPFDYVRCDRAGAQSPCTLQQGERRRGLVAAGVAAPRGGSEPVAELSSAQERTAGAAAGTPAAPPALAHRGLGRNNCQPNQDSLARVAGQGQPLSAPPGLRSEGRSAAGPAQPLPGAGAGPWRDPFATRTQVRCQTRSQGRISSRAVWCGARARALARPKLRPR